MRFILLMLLFAADTAWATQTHGDPEGLYVHQSSHLFFIFSMAILIYWLRSRKLVRESGWRRIQYASALFIVWSFDAFLAHYLDEQTDIIRAVYVDLWRIQIESEFSILPALYYCVKLDHLILVPAIFIFYSGLKQLSGKDPAVETGAGTGAARP